MRSIGGGSMSLFKIYTTEINFTKDKKSDIIEV